MTTFLQCHASHVHRANSGGYVRRYFSLVGIWVTDNILTKSAQGSDIDNIFGVGLSKRWGWILSGRRRYNRNRARNGRKVSQGCGRVLCIGSRLGLDKSFAQMGNEESGGRH